MAERCKARRTKPDGTRQRCSREVVASGLCERHIGPALAPQAVRGELVRTVERALDGLVTPIPLDDPEANPATALHHDFRRTVARIRFLESRIAEFTEEDLQWGKTKEERITASEFAGTNTTYEARVPIFEELLARERAHLLKITDLMAKTSFQAAELALRQQSAATMRGVLDEIVTVLGHDVNDPETQALLAPVFLPAERAEAEQKRLRALAAARRERSKR